LTYSLLEDFDVLNINLRMINKSFLKTSKGKIKIEAQRIIIPIGIEDDI
jgi:hypothetical protein